MTPIVDGIEQEYRDKIVVKRVNALVGNGPAIMEEYRIPGHPVTLIINPQGNESARLIGPQSWGLLEEELHKILN